MPKIHTGLLALLVTCWPVWGGVAAAAAELTPYSPPPGGGTVSPGAPVQEIQPQQQYYERFAADINDLTPVQRTNMVQDLVIRRDNAYKTGKINEANHYQNLINIIEGK